MPQTFTRRRRFERLLADFRRALEPSFAGRHLDAFWHAAWNVGDFIPELARDLAKTRALLAVMDSVRVATGPGRQVAEERLMEQLVVLARNCQCAGDGDFAVEVPGHPPIREAEASRERAREGLREVCGFAMGCFSFRRPHDSFGGRRRRLAFQILARAVPSFVAPEWVALARETIRAGKGTEIAGALEFMEAHLRREDTPLSDEIADELLAFAARAGTRSLAVGALNVFVEAGIISEFTALDQIEDWTEARRDSQA